MKKLISVLVVLSLLCALCWAMAEESDQPEMLAMQRDGRAVALHAYVQEAHFDGFSTLWSDWLAAREAENPAA